MEINQKLLETLGLSLNDFEVYKKVYVTGPITILELNHITKIPRSTLYEILERLIKLGLATYIIQSRSKKVVAESPERLNFILSSKRNDALNQLKVYESQQKKLPHLVEEIINLEKLKEMPQTKLKFFQGYSEVKNVYDEIFSSHEIKVYANANWIYEIMPEIPKYFVNMIKENKLIDFDLFIEKRSSSKAFEEIDKYVNYQYKVLPYNNDLEGIDYSIYQDKVAIIYMEEQPSAIVIENKFINKNALALFNILWNLL